MVSKTLLAKGTMAILAALLLTTSVLIGQAAAVPVPTTSAAASMPFMHDRKDRDDDDDRRDRDRRDRRGRRRRDRDDDDDRRFFRNRRFSKKQRSDWFRDWRDLNRGRGRDRDRDHDRDWDGRRK